MMPGEEGIIAITKYYLVPEYINVKCEYSDVGPKIKIIIKEMNKEERECEWNVNENKFISTSPWLEKYLNEALNNEIIKQDVNKMLVSMGQNVTLNSAPSAPSKEGNFLVISLNSKIEDIERQYIPIIYKKAKYNKTLTAKMLGISLKTLYRKLSKYKNNLFASLVQ